MKKLGTVLILLFVSNGLLANENPDATTKPLTLAAVDTSNSATWAREITPAAPATTRLEDALEEKSIALGEKINAQLEKALEEKLNREMAF